MGLAVGTAAGSAAGSDPCACCPDSDPEGEPVDCGSVVIGKSPVCGWACDARMVPQNGGSVNYRSPGFSGQTSDFLGKRAFLGKAPRWGQRNAISRRLQNIPLSSE